MKTIIRNFLSVLRRFKMATALNVAGLAVAFAAFIVILIQINFDRTFDRCHPTSGRIFRVDLTIPGTFGTILPRAFVEAVIQSSPHIEAGTLLTPSFGQNGVYLSVDRNGQPFGFKEIVTTCHASLPKIFAFPIVEGDIDCLKDPEKVMVPRSLADKLFGEDISAVGKTLRAEENIWTKSAKLFTIGAVYKDFPENTQLRNVVYTAIDPDYNINNFSSSNWVCYLLLDNPAMADEVADNFNRHFDFKKIYHEGEQIRLVPLTDIYYMNETQDGGTFRSGNKEVTALLFGIALLIVIVAAINFTNFSTSLTPLRIKSINTQKVLGSSDGVLRFSLLMEAVCISVVAYLLALWFVYIAAKTPVAGLVDADMSFAAHPLLLTVTGLIALLTGLLAGLYPSYYMTSFSPALVLKGSFGLSPQGRVLRNALISIQFIASFVLIIGSMFMYLQNNFMQSSPLGYDKDQLIVTSITAPILKSSDAFESRLKSFAGIEDVTYGEFMLSSQDQYMEWGRELRGQTIQFQCMPIDPSFLKVMNIHVNEGRDFREEDALTVNGAFIFNERAKNLYELVLGDKIQDADVVGFIPDIKFASFRTEVTPMAFYVRGTGYSGGAAYAYVKVKAGSDMRAAMTHVKEVLGEIHPDYPFDIKFFDQVLNTLYEKEESLSSLITLFSMIAVFISIVGVFGLVVFDSQYRKKEIGIRKVMGSTTSEILIMFNKTYVYILCICFVVAAPVAFYSINKWLESFAYKTPIYWWVFVIAFILVSMITIITVTFQNWRAARENPVFSIKNE